jgi:hypothetical protein
MVSFSLQIQLTRIYLFSSTKRFTTTKGRKIIALLSSLISLRFPVLVYSPWGIHSAVLISTNIAEVGNNEIKRTSYHRCYCFPQYFSGEMGRTSHLL